ncbi:MAG TPA: hypothetical protein VF725_10300 [Ktedonobacterales bacterium]
MSGSRVGVGAVRRRDHLRLTVLRNLAQGSEIVGLRGVDRCVARQQRPSDV